MSGLRRSFNPYLRGYSPKSFLYGRVQLLRKEQTMKDWRSFDPDWANDKKKTTIVDHK